MSAFAGPVMVEIEFMDTCQCVMSVGNVKTSGFMSIL